MNEFNASTNLTPELMELDEIGTNANSTAPTTPLRSSASFFPPSPLAHKPKKTPSSESPIKLEGRLIFLKPIVETQRMNFQKVIVNCAKTMLKIDREIRDRLATLHKFSSKIQDPTDCDEEGNPREKTFIPASLRKPLDLNISSLVKNDSRCATELTEITTTMKIAMDFHQKYQTDIANCMKKMAETEIRARKTILASEYSKTMLTIAEGLIIVGKHQPGRSPTLLTDKELAFAATYELLKKLPDAHWARLNFLEKTLTNSKESFLTEYFNSQKPLDVHHIAQRATAADKSIICYAANKLTHIWPHMTTNLWNYDLQCDRDKKTDAELASLMATNSVKDANDKFADAMDNGADKTVLPLIQKEVARQLGKRASKAKQAARKKSLGDPKNQRSTPKKNGTSKTKKSTRDSNKTMQRSSLKLKPPSTDGSDSNTSTSSASRKRGRTTNRTPRPILKKGKKIRWSTPDPRRKKRSSSSDPDQDESGSGESSNERKKR